MSIRRFAAVAVFLLGAATLVGCSDSSSTPINTAPTEKQKQKEQMKTGSGDGGQKK